MGIKFKIYLLGTLLPIFALIIFAGYTLTESKKFSLSGLERATSLSNDAAIKSRISLETHGKKLIISQAADRALFSYQALSRISDLTSTLALEASTIWEHNAEAPNEKAYLRTETPSQPERESVVRVAPDSNDILIQKDISHSLHLNPFFRNAKLKNPIIKSIYIGTENGLQFRMPWVSAHKVGYDPRTRGWYKAALMEETTGWSDLYTGASEGVLMVTSYAPIYDYAHKLIGVIGVDVSLADLNETLLNTSYDKGVGVLLDRDKSVVAHSLGGEEVVTAFKDNLSLAPVKKMFADLANGSSNLIEIELAGEKTYVVCNPIEGTDWTLCFFIPIKSVNSIAQEISKKILSAKDSTAVELSRQFSATRNHALVALGVIMLIFLLLAYKISQSMIQPIEVLTKGVKVMGGGEFDTKLDVQSGDELQELAESFNDMGDELRKYMENLEKTTSEKERIQSELTIATDIQASMLPRIFPAFPDIKSMDIFASMTPAKEVGGDFYDFFLLDENRVCITIADVSGKGVPAALFMVISKTLLQNCVRAQSDDLGAAVTRLNEDLCKDNDQMLFVTIFCAIIDLTTGACEFVNAGHNPPVFIRDGKVEYISAKPVFPVCGVMEEMEYLSGSLTFSPGDKIFLYTDGVTEAFNVDLQLYGEEKLLKELSKCTEKTIADGVVSITESIENFAEGAEQSDDITMLFFEYNGQQSDG